MNKKITLAFIMMLLIGVFAASVNIRIAKASTVQNITLYGRVISPTGWSFTSGGETTPGPTITVNQGDTVNLTLISDDGVPHQFFVDYNNNDVIDTGEPHSIEFSTNTHFNFTANLNGTFTYRCAVHPTMMYGTFTVDTVIPEFTSTPILMLFMIATLLAVAVYRRKSP